MPITAPNTPGVQINEVRLEAPPIVGTGTSTAAFVGIAPVQRLPITISSAVVAGTAIPVKALTFAMAAGAVLTKVTGDKASSATITLNATAPKIGATSITSAANVTVTANDVYSAEAAATGNENTARLMTSPDQFLQEYATGANLSTPLSRAVLGCTRRHPCS